MSYETCDGGEYVRDKRRKNIVDDPWYGRCHTDVTELHYKVIPCHASQDPNEPVPNFDRCATDVTERLRSRPSSPTRAEQDCYYGKVSTDVTRHLETRSPKFVNPQCGPECEQEVPYYGIQRTDVTNYRLSPPESPKGPNLTEFMHPLGKSRPPPFTQMFFHDQSRPKSRSVSPHSKSSSKCTHNSSSPKHPLSPTGGYGSPPSCRVSPPRSPGPPRHISPPRSRSRSPPRGQEQTYQPNGGYGNPPVCEEPEVGGGGGGGYGNPPLCNSTQDIPAPFLNCTKRCQLCPPCSACQQLLEVMHFSKKLNTRHQEKDDDIGQHQYQSAKHCTGITMGGGGISRRGHCQFHGTSPCPAQAGLPCYGMRPWG